MSACPAAYGGVGQGGYLTTAIESYGEGSDMDMRASVRAVEQKLALKAQIDGARRPPKAIADIVGVAPQTLHGWADVSIDSHIPGARIPAFLSATEGRGQASPLLAYWAELVGQTVVSLPVAGCERADVQQLAELAGAFAALLTHHAVASRDGRWTDQEVAELRPIATELAARAMAQLAYAERQVGPVVELASSRRTA